MPAILIALMSPPLAAPTFDSLPPVYKFAEEARERGYEVNWCCSEEMAARIHRDHPHDAIRAYPNPTLLGTPRLLQPFIRRALSADIPQSMLPEVEKGPNNEWLFDSYVTAGFDDENFFFAAMETMLRAIIEFEPDLLYTYGCPVGLTAGHISGVPLVTFDNLMRLRNEGGDNYRRMNDTVQKAIAIYSPGAPHHISLEDIIRNEKQFRILSTIKYLHRKPYQDNEFFVGGFERPAGLRDPSKTYIQPRFNPERRNVFAYFGSASISHRVVRKVLPEVFDVANRLCTKPYDCYVMSSFVDAPYTEGAVHFAPTYDVPYILPYCVYNFSHGGINAVMESLVHGVPLIMVPGAIHERRHNAREVAAVDCGILIEVEDFTVPHLSSLLLDQTQELVLRSNARRMQQLIQETGGMKAAFEAMQEGWLRPYDRQKLAAIGRRLQSL